MIKLSLLYDGHCSEDTVHAYWMVLRSVEDECPNKTENNIKSTMFYLFWDEFLAPKNEIDLNNFKQLSDNIIKINLFVRSSFRLFSEVSCWLTKLHRVSVPFSFKYLYNSIDLPVISEKQRWHWYCSARCKLKSKGQSPSLGESWSLKLVYTPTTTTTNF